jgi:hypothetical protein
VSWYGFSAISIIVEVHVFRVAVWCKDLYPNIVQGHMGVSKAFNVLQKEKKIK